jgi:HSP20 family protein
MIDLHPHSQRNGSRADASEFHVYLSETDAIYTLKAEVPGVREEDVEVRIDGYEVKITQKPRDDARGESNAGAPHAADPEWPLRRSVWLDCRVDAAKMVVNCHDGVLELSLPK